MREKIQVVSTMHGRLRLPICINMLTEALEYLCKHTRTRVHACACTPGDWRYGFIPGSDGTSWADVSIL